MAGSPLLKEVRSRTNLERAWRVIEDNGRFSKSETVRSEIEAFRERAFNKLRSLGDKLRRGTFRFPPARAVPILKGNKKDRASFRPIVLAPVEARIVQRSILGVLTDVEDLRPYFRNPNSFGGIKKAEGQELAAVPAAIQEVLSAIGDGAAYVSCADISGFFTRISKSAVTGIISDVVRDDDFMALLTDAVRVELSNMAELRERADKFPIHDIGVAQGNSLSPLLGNVILHDFDRIMNEGDCRCIRYIDDFIVLAPTRRAAAARMRVAARHLAGLGMSLSPEKTHAEPRGVADGFEFLGIELRNGLIRPSPKAQQRLITSIGETLDDSAAAFRARRRGTALLKSQSLLGTLRRVDGAIQGWGRHYRFCNDEVAFEALDAAVTRLIRGYLGAYAGEREASCDDGRRTLLGIESLATMQRTPFPWPAKRDRKRERVPTDLTASASGRASEEAAAALQRLDETLTLSVTGEASVVLGGPISVARERGSLRRPGVKSANRHAVRRLPHPVEDILQAYGGPIPAIDADVEAGAGSGQAAVGVAVEVKVAVPGVGPCAVGVVAAPDGLRLGHTGILHEHALDVDDGSVPFQALSECVVVAADKADATVQASADGGSVS